VERFYRILLINSVFVCALVAARLSYHRHIHPAGLVAIAAVLVLYAAGAAACIWIAAGDGDRDDDRILEDVHELAERLPAVAMLGTVSGFLIALSSSSGDVQHRATGASTALAATFVGIAAWLVLGLQHRLLARGRETS
jgi:hypothetical protein